MNEFFDSTLVLKQGLAIRLITSALAKDRLAHAYLFTSQAADDKWLVALQLASYLNCRLTSERAPGQLSCGQSLGWWSRSQVASLNRDYCPNCRWIAEEKHPQALFLLNSQGSKSGIISVEKARQLQEELSKESSFHRVVIIENAAERSFHRPCANALLKTIESPRGKTIFLLFAERLEDVLPTVVSRCQVVPFNAFNQGILGRERDSGMSDIQSEATAAALQQMQRQLETLGHLKDSEKEAKALFFADLVLDNEENFASLGECIDRLVTIEVSRIANEAVYDPSVSLYINKLIEIAEDAKDRLDSFVSARSALESLFLRWWHAGNSFHRTRLVGQSRKSI